MPWGPDMHDVILVLDSGSSSLKFAVYEMAVGSAPLSRLAHGQVEGLGAHPHFTAFNAEGHRLDDSLLPVDGSANPHEQAMGTVLAWLQAHRDGTHRLVAAGHRVVHGGMLFASPVRIDGEVLLQLDTLSSLAPLHQPPALRAIRALQAKLPELPQVACFDTAFHRTQPEVAQAYALPRSLSDEGIRRYGFHGLSYQYISQTLPQFLGEKASGKVVVAHLGNGASMCGMQGQRSMATTMGFTALDGLVMGTRCGNLDPGVVLHLIDQKGLSPAQVSELLYKQSGLLGVSGLSSDLRELLGSDTGAAQEAIELFVYRAVRELGSLAAALGGLDALVFTAGIGEHSAEVRQRICEQSRWLGIELDPQANAQHGPCITAAGSPVSVWVIPTNEESVIADAVARVVLGSVA
ncbi:acetate/propionate family kinase [Hydrogenophaga sp. PAMC20947]|uniref:acetate/propionate family kinase n=1 Tax=Hydrogenophaga sp. PAMC20947 TaxID=2565558 RepID=UPI001FF9982F|nr:acetate/propionate family kinase [Hydrogenophaga sp. PAMC20947]